MTGEKCTLNNCSNAPGIAMRQIDSVFESSGFFEANITVTFTNGQVEMVQYSPRGIYPGLAGQTKPGNTNGPTSTSNAPETKTTKASSSKRDSLGLFALTAILLF
jgi:hypothetical protein